MDNEKQIVNSIYHGMILSTTAIGYGYLFKKFFRMRVDSIDKFTLEEILKLGGIITLSTYTVDMMIQRGIIPKDIMK